MAEDKKKEVHVYRLQLDMEVTVEADDLEEAGEALSMYLDREGLNHDAIDTTLMEVVPADLFEAEDYAVNLKAGE